MLKTLRFICYIWNVMGTDKGHNPIKSFVEQLLHKALKITKIGEP